MTEPRADPIFEPDWPIVDTHHHLFLRSARRYLADDLAADLASGHHIAATVYVEAGGFIGSGGFWRQDGPNHLRPLGEVEFANGVGAMGDGGYFGKSRPCAAIVGHANLAEGDRIAELLDRCLSAAPDRFRGVRQAALHHPDPAAPPGLASRPPEGLLRSAAFRRGFAHLSRNGLSFDVAVYHTQIAEVAELADAFPDTQLVLNHMSMIYAVGAAAERRATLFAEWRACLTELARRPNVTCKISGLGMPLWDFDLIQEDGQTPLQALVKAWRPLVEVAIESFGPDRCMTGSNYPIDGVTASYADVWSALKTIISGYSQAERNALLFKTASSTYRIPLHGNH